MTITDILTPSRTLCDLEGGSKKRILETVGNIIAEQTPSLDADAVFAGLINRERLGSTGFGDGVAIPHCRLSNCNEALGYLIKLQTPIDFDAIDRQPVDLLFVLIVPEEACEEHLTTLSSIAELLSKSEVREQLRNAHTAESLYKVIQHQAV
ncbi:PTS IIA-like nitrogen regulatory protein PtsN [Marinobacterium arenosum]|uniref:PTS IIA-like nitrogen regulatory protein PtsN n=1 Tax=Marinobacterium arenosum TaxID=2862496 RepID=UPI001C959FA9|nr:PTS IIA-like nitrogen regulatory protein PtsN [Marinobacterium arenosum]MBY4676758.1 PTS IIA-like nitrogen regulatory protein PtsN [Marinobacterium arenosum]